MPAKGEYKEFRELLRSGIGTRTQKAFAEETGISKEHINRLLNNREIVPPSKKTISAMAAHMSNITERQLLKSCGYGQPDIASKIAGVERAVMEGLASCTAPGVKLYASAGDAVEKCVLPPMAACGAPGAAIGKIREAFVPESCPQAEKAYRVPVVWGDDEYSCRTVFDLYCSATEGGKVLVLGSSPVPTNDAVLMDAIGLSDPDFPRGTFTRVSRVKKPSAEGSEFRNMLLDYLGSGEKYVTTATGFGFYYPSTPERFLEYLSLHAGSFCTTKERAGIYQEALKDGADIESLFASYGNGIFHGTGSAVASVMSVESGYKFEYFTLHKDLEDDGSEECLPCIMTKPRDWDPFGPVPMDILCVLFQTAKELGIEEFGICYHRELKKKTVSRRYKTDSFHLEYIPKAKED